METWQQQMNQSLADPLELSQALDLDVGSIGPIAERYPVRLTPYLLEQMTGPEHPLWQQFVPDPAELRESGLPDDPLDEAGRSPIPAVIHRYPQRALLLAANSCAAYCRFCTRKRRVGNRDRGLSFGEVLDGIAYIAAKTEINEVIISGGDPLTMSDGLLRELLERLRQIDHVEIIRLATRTTAVLPGRITPQLVRLLGRYQPLFVTTHFNHPVELTPAAKEACSLLADAGIPLANQAVLLRGVNDEASILADLCTGLLKNRVRPYYLHQLDQGDGTAHFSVSPSKGLELMAELRRRVSGLAMPHYIVDTPGGHGKVELVPDNILSRDAARWTLRAPDGTAVTIMNEGE